MLQNEFNIRLEVNKVVEDKNIGMMLLLTIRLTNKYIIYATAKVAGDDKQ